MKNNKYNNFSLKRKLQVKRGEIRAFYVSVKNIKGGLNKILNIKGEPLNQ